MGAFSGPKEPSIDLSLNQNNLVTITLKNIPATEYRIKVDGILSTITPSSSNSTVSNITVSPGLTRNITVEAYKGNSLSFTTSKYVKIFDYVGAAQTWAVPSNVKYLKADVQGASGGSSGGLGGRAKSYIKVNGGETLYFYCGGAGQDAIGLGCTATDPGFKAGGFNGGGNGGGKSDAYICPVGQTTYALGASGGGASDIRRITNDLTSRIIVAGGGGGSNGGGGNGSGENGVDGGFNINGSWTSSVRGIGATISSPGLGGTSVAGASYSGTAGVLGVGGTGARFVQYGDNGGAAAGGGGGFYGGGGGGAGSNFGAAGGGGGGSGYIDPSTKSLVSSNLLGTISSGYRTGDGRILISWTSQSSYSDIVTSGLVLNVDAQNYYSYPGSGTTWTDLSGSGNNGTFVNGLTYSTSNGGSIVFDGIDDRIECGNFSVQYLTISTWVYKTSSATNQGICRKETGWAVSQYNGTLQVAPGTSWTFYNTNYTIPLNTWVNIVYTYSGSGTTGSQTVYINGSNIYSTTAGSGAIGANANAVRIGYDDNNWFWGGRIAQTQIYNRALSIAEVQQNFNAQRGRFNI